MKSKRLLPIIQGLLAAFLFGASAPISKLLLADISPVFLAALLYLGSGLGLLGIKSLTVMGHQENQEARLAGSDWLWLAGAIVCGGVIAPILLMVSLTKTPAATASLLLNFEGVSTTLLAAIIFKESISRHAWWAIGLITLASILLSTDFTKQWGFSLSALGVLVACLMWGVDNNLTRNISAKDPLASVAVKGLGAGMVSLLIALALGNPFPRLGSILLALLLGFLSYGLSIFLFVHAMRGLGAGRTSALFGTAPLAGILLSIIIFRENPGIFFLFALVIMASGAYILIKEDHSHEHLHDEFVHDHRHAHLDGHHVHEHAAGSANQSHSHIHIHDSLKHTHDHAPDLHHRHSHKSDPV
jgi:drug/metabolite transporter (DMT)-like permease